MRFHSSPNARIRTLGILAAVVLIASVLAFRWAMLAVAAVEVAPDDVTAGTASHGKVTLDQPSPFKVFTVALSSANSGIATVPASINIGESQISQSFSIRTTSGAAGCTEISARAGTSAARTTVIVVRPPVSSGPLQLILSPGTLTASGSATGTVTLSGVPAGNHTVRLASSNPQLATVPASVSVPVTQVRGGTQGSATFQVVIPLVLTAGTQCPTISAKHEAGATSALLRLQPPTPIGGN